MYYKIKKGDKFLCLQDYIMDEGHVAYQKGKIYISQKDNCITDEQRDEDHSMIGELDFFYYFEELTEKTKSFEKKNKIKIKKLHPDAVMPFYATDGAAAMDLTAIKVEKIDYQHYKYSFGLAFEIPRDKVGLIFPRSSCYKQRQIISNCVGVIDSDYRGEVSAVMIGTSDNRYLAGDRVVQIMFINAPQVELIEVEELSSTERGSGAYGSTGK
jgi:dUTP pyrophosphatase